MTQSTTFVTVRGERALYTSMFPPDHICGQKDRRNAQLDQRDDLIAARYYYHAELKRFADGSRSRYEDCLNRLAEEFFLTPTVITQRLTRREDYIREFKAKARTRQYFRKKYPWMVW